MAMQHDVDDLDGILATERAIDRPAFALRDALGVEPASSDVSASRSRSPSAPPEVRP